MRRPDPLQHIHGARIVPGAPQDVVAALVTDGARLAAAATRAAAASLAELQASGGFQRPADPAVTVTTDVAPAALRVAWNQRDDDHWPAPDLFALRPTSPWWRADEEETGWPSATIDLLVEPADEGARVVALVDRPPDWAARTSRVDRRVRDQLAAAAIERFLDELAAGLARAEAGVPDGDRLVATGG